MFESIAKKISRFWQTGEKPKKVHVKPSVNSKPKPKFKTRSHAHSRARELEKRAKLVADKEEYLYKKEVRLEDLEKKVERTKKKSISIKKSLQKKLEEIAGFTKNQAEEELKKQVGLGLVSWKAGRIREIKEELKIEGDELAKEILLEAIRHGVVDWVAEYTVSTLKLKDEDIKGKVIGRDGRNIRAFERTTGVELELDETNEIRLSCFDSVRREIARIALEKLIKDGRIQPSKIEQVVSQVKQDMNKILVEQGKKICQQAGVYNLPIDLVKLIGKFKYRFSQGQNLAQHTLEGVKIGVALAKELKADTKVVRLACLLHDIGKVVSDKEGSHVDLGVELLKKYDIPEEVITCVAEHHEDHEFSSPESVIVWISDAASGSRPGARYEAHEKYLERMKNIEEAVKSTPGVKSVAAYQAGREVRIIVNPNQISDDELTVLLQEIGEKLKNEVKWAGQMKLTAIREKRVTSKLSG